MTRTPRRADALGLLPLLGLTLAAVLFKRLGDALAPGGAA